MALPGWLTTAPSVRAWPPAAVLFRARTSGRDKDGRLLVAKLPKRDDDLPVMSGVWCARAMPHIELSWELCGRAAPLAREGHPTALSIGRGSALEPRKERGCAACGAKSRG